MCARQAGGEFIITFSDVGKWVVNRPVKFEIKLFGRDLDKAVGYRMHTAKMKELLLLLLLLLLLYVIIVAFCCFYMSLLLLWIVI